MVPGEVAVVSRGITTAGVCERSTHMWAVLGVAVTVTGWLLVMIAIWTLLYDGDGRTTHPGDADQH